MKKLLLIILSCSYMIIAFGQTDRDSLWQVSNDTELADTVRMIAMNHLIRKAYKNQPDSALYIRDLQYKLAESTANKSWMARALHKIGKIYYYQSDYTQAMEYYTRSLKIKEEIGDKKGITFTLTSIGIAYHYQGEYSQALRYQKRSLKIGEEIGNKKGIATNLSNIGITYVKQGNYSQAIDYCTKGLKIHEEIGHKNGIASSLVNIGSIYKSQGNYSQAIDYHTRGLKITEEIGHKKGIAASLANIGNIYTDQGDYGKAMEYQKRSLKITEEIGDKPNIATILRNIGMIYSKQGDDIQAMEYAMKSLKICEKIGYKEGIAFTLGNIGYIHAEQEDYAQAILYSARSLALAQEIGIPPLISETAENLYKSYKATGQYRQALEMHKLHIQMCDSINNEQNQKAVIQQQYKYKYEKKALADSLEQDKEELRMQLAHETEIRKESNIRNIAIGLGLLILLVAIALWARNQFVRKTNTQLQAAKDRAERSEAHKQQFLANMSHEIRTPMHAISGMVKILRRNKHLSEQEVFLHAMHQSSDNLIVLLNDILDLSKIEAGKLDVESMPMQPASVIQNVHQILQFKAAEKGLELHTAVSPDLPTSIMGDPTRLGQILTNLAGNAIKFTKKGSVSIFASRKNDFLIYEVRDTGMGIPEDKLQSIFEAFEQAETSTNRRFGGTGLGLNISRQLVELQGGNIWAESEVGKGSTFFVSLPLIAIQEDVEKQQHLNEGQLVTMASRLSGKRILLAEDNEFNQMIAQDDLVYYIPDVQIDIAENGAIALEKYKKGQYDLVLMDVQMPTMDGYEATLKIRDWEQENGKKAIPIVAMTASVLKTEVNLCFEAGMNNYIPKPYEAEELIGVFFDELINKV